MEREQLLKKVNEVFQDVFYDTSLEVNDETTAADIDEWDSLTHITLIAAIEDEFDIKFDMTEVVKFEKVGDMIDSIQKKLCK